MPNLIWFRRDLRIRDNPALHAAAKSADGVIALYIHTPKTCAAHAIGKRQLDFIDANLQSLSLDLEKRNIPLLVHEVPAFSDIPALLIKIVKELEITAVYCNRQYELDERQRDKAVHAALQDAGCRLFRFDDQVIIPPEKILTAGGLPYKVFTPFKRKWLEMAEQFYQNPLPAPKQQPALPVTPDRIVTNKASFGSWLLPGEAAAHSQLKKFCKKKLHDYHKTRDFPAIDGTSCLSPWLAIGVISARQCLAEIFMQVPGFSAFNNKTGVSVWVSELVWREFYKNIVWHFPDVCKFRPFQPDTDRLPWSDDDTLFDAWRSGMTGFPLVDAGMRQLNQTGWMHNRLRMVTAMFLAKILFIDWRRGERYFSENLVDCDFSANNGGWQWSASTGTDAVPWFRIFNPLLQSQRFDPEGVFIRKFCPELARLNNSDIHDPYGGKNPLLKSNYPQKIIDYKYARERVLAAFKANSQR